MEETCFFKKKNNMCWEESCSLRFEEHNGWFCLIVQNAMDKIFLAFGYNEVPFFSTM